jgi:hypothetical protein
LAVALPAACPLATARATTGAKAGKARRFAPGNDFTWINLCLASAGTARARIEVGAALGRLHGYTDLRSLAQHCVDACSDRVACNLSRIARFRASRSELGRLHAQVLSDSAASLRSFSLHLHGYVGEVACCSYEGAHFDVRPRIGRKAHVHRISVARELRTRGAKGAEFAALHARSEWKKHDEQHHDRARLHDTF